MDIDNFSYEKGDRQEKLEISSEPSEVSNSQRHIEERMSTIIPPPLGYRKEEGVLTPLLFFILSGGEVRERVYLQSLERKHEFDSIRLIFLSSDKRKGGLTPRMMMKKWEEMCRDKKVNIGGNNYHLLEFDRIFFLTDVDHYEPELREIISHAAKNERTQWIISNPDFEIWLYYSFFNSPQDDLKELEQAAPEKRSSLLKQINGSFNKGGGLDTRKAFECLPQAIHHSKLNYKEDAMHFPFLLSTQMHILAEEILAVAGEEYDRWLADKKRKAKSFLRT